VLLNVMLNAGAAITASKREDGAIVARVRAAGGRVRVEIEDNGPGIPPEVEGRLFEPFVTTKPTGEGTGLGLAVCRGLVESAGGTIVVDPSYEAGARFVIELPAADPQATVTRS
jgi:C4-dicarboxylate-specific signal transduction histidine kinase